MEKGWITNTEWEREGRCERGREEREDVKKPTKNMSRFGQHSHSRIMDALSYITGTWRGTL
jgi:hypothetical protein